MTRTGIRSAHRSRPTYKAAIAACSAILVGLLGVTGTAAAATGTKGTINREFGAGGIARLPFPNAVAGNANSDAQGRIVVSGYATEGQSRSLVVARYLLSGQLDPSFGTRGIVRLATNLVDAGPVNGMNAILADGRIVVVGSFPGAQRILVARLLPSGAFDHSFNATGRADVVHGFASTLAVDAAGRVLVSGAGDVELMMWRFTSGGRLDTTFGVNGIARPQIASHANVFGLVFDSSGRIVVAGTAKTGVGYVARLGANGTVDQQFGTAGKTFFPEIFQLASVAIQPDGRIVAGGGTTGPIRMVAVRVLANGARDASFGTHGIAVARNQGRVSSANAIALTPDGSILLAGSGGNTTIDYFGSFAVAGRLLPDGRTDRTFACGGGAWIRLGPEHSLVSSVVYSHGVAILVGDAYGDATAGIALTRLDLGASEPGGYAMATATGGVDGFGSAPACRSIDDLSLRAPIVGIATTPSGHGDWLTAADGGVFAMGDANFFGSTGALRLNQPVVGITATHTGHGYWLTAADGGVFTFGDAHFYGSTGAIRLNQPIVGITATRSGHGYWLTASDGGVFTFGDAGFRGSAVQTPPHGSFVGVASTP